MATRTWRFRPWLILPIWLSVALSVSTTAHCDLTRFGSAQIADGATCRIVESAARFAGVPADLLTRLVWLESRFRADVTSSAGAQGIAQFMPQTAAERGLANPFDPEQAIPRAAELLADLALRFGNIGLAVAAYSAGPGRVGNWLAGAERLPAETAAYVLTLTGRSAEDWAADRRGIARADQVRDLLPCVEIAAALRASEGSHMLAARPALSWGGNFLTALGEASFERARQNYCRHALGERPIITGTILAGGGIRPDATLSGRDMATRNRLRPALCATYLQREPHR